MKILFIFPNFEKIGESQPNLRNIFCDINRKLRYSTNNPLFPGVGIFSIIANSPQNYDIIFIDDQYEKIDYDKKFDIVAISAFTPQAVRAYEIADEFRKRNQYVVLGGKHISSLPDEAKQHADSIFIGEAEIIWQQFLDDFKNGTPKKVYIQPRGTLDFNEINNPDRTILKKLDIYKLDFVTIELIRGCRARCFYCPINELESRKYRYKSFENILKELDSIKFKKIYIANDNLFSGVHKYEYIADLLNCLKESKKEFAISSSIIFLKKFLKGKKEIELLKDSGFQYFELVYNYDSSFILQNMRKNLYKDLWESTGKFELELQDNNFIIMPYFTIGTDFDDKTIFQQIIKYSKAAKFKFIEINIATPYPGTPFYFQLLQENRLLHTKWSKYNNANIVFKPKNMTVNELLNGYYWCWEEFYKNN